MKINFFIAAAAIALSLFSFLVVAAGATEEPYFQFVPAQALIQVGAGSVLIAFWLEWMAIVCVLLALRRINWTWSLGVAWCGICLFYLMHSRMGYVEDIARFAAAG